MARCWIGRGCEGGEGDKGERERESLFADWILNVTADEAPKARTRIFTRALSFNRDIFNYFYMSHEQQLPCVQLLFLSRCTVEIRTIRVTYFRSYFPRALECVGQVLRKHCNCDWLGRCLNIIIIRWICDEIHDSRAHYPVIICLQRYIFGVII